MANAIREQRTRGVRAVDHALGILTAFDADTPVLGLTELSQRLRLSKSGLHALLASLERAGFVIRDEQAGKYALGFRLLHLANLRLEHTPIRSLARPLLERLAFQLIPLPLDLDSTLAFFADPDTNSCKGGRYNIPELTDAVRKARDTKDVSARKQLYAQVGKLAVDNVMDVQLVYPSTSVVMTPKVGGFQVWGDGFMRWDEVTVQA